MKARLHSSHGGEPVEICLRKLGLSPTKRNIMRLRLRHFTVEQVAEKLDRKRPTIATHIRQVYERLQVHDMREFASLIETHVRQSTAT